MNDDEAEEIAYVICQGIKEIEIDNTMDPLELNFNEREKFDKIPDADILSKILESGVELN